MDSAGRTWEAGLKGLSSPQASSSGIGGVVPASPTATEVAGIDEPFADAFTGLDYQLLTAEAVAGFNTYDGN